MARILLGITGGIAAFKAAGLVRLLRSRGHEVRCACSRAAANFVTPLSLEVLSGERVFREEYLSANGSGEELHITAAQWADAVCVAPATTHFLARLAHGFGDDFLTTTLLAFRGPVVVAPAMHETMWDRATTRGNVERLREQGVAVIGPDVGLLANGDTGAGRMAELVEIAAAVERAVGAGDLRGNRVVVTAGPTHEALDPVRFLCNRSSGRMGFALAEAAAVRGADVELIAGPVSLETPAFVKRRDVVSAREMERALADSGGADLVIMCAAVADYRPATAATDKIKRRPEERRSLELVANPDLLAGLATTMPEAVRVGFAAETRDLEENALGKLRRKAVHFLCANDVSRRDVGFESTDNELVVFGDDGSRVLLEKAPKRELADRLLDLFVERLRGREP